MRNIYDDYSKICYGAKIGSGVKIGHSVGIGERAEIGDYVDIGNGARIGKYVEIGDYVRIGDYSIIGESTKIGDSAQIGDCTTMGYKFRCEGLEVVDFFTMSNVDGTGRRIYIYIHTEGITVRAGCFKGTLDEFCMKAEDEEKYLYSVTVRAAAEAFAAEVRRQGKTGGWDK